MDADKVQVNPNVDLNDPEQKDLPTTPEAALNEMKKINKYIKEVSNNVLPL